MIIRWLASRTVIYSVEQRRQPGLKTGGHGIRLWTFLNDLFKIRPISIYPATFPSYILVISTQISIFIHKHIYFGKVKTLESVLVSYFFTFYDIIIFPRNSTNLTPKFGGFNPTPRINAYAPRSWSLILNLRHCKRLLASCPKFRIMAFNA